MSVAIIMIVMTLCSSSSSISCHYMSFIMAMLFVRSSSLTSSPLSMPVNVMQSFASQCSPVNASHLPVNAHQSMPVICQLMLTSQCQSFASQCSPVNASHLPVNAHQSPLGFDERPVLSVDLVVEATSVA